MITLRPATLAALALLSLASGCATKKHVRASIQPLEKRVEELESQTKKNETSISDLERNLSQTDERVRGADSRANQAALEAAKANERAARSGELAEAAGRSAQDAKAAATTEANRVKTELDEKITSLDNYDRQFSEAVLFGFGSHTLNPEAKKVLDGVAEKVLLQHRYVVEVQGFTDKTGDPEYNLQLSRRRAESVVQHLTVQHKVPLHRIFLNGAGGELPAADNKTAEGRRQNRRVEVRLYTPKAR
jgi:outer membrane protein OmpA-like peptidoglycan-associated protein